MLRRARDLQQLSQADAVAACRIRIWQADLSQIETGQRRPDAALLSELCRVYRLSGAAQLCIARRYRQTVILEDAIRQAGSRNDALRYDSAAQAEGD